MELKFHKVSSLPGGTLDAHAIYFVLNGSYAESYVTDSAGVAKSVGNSTMIDTLIAAKIAGLSQTIIVADITARNALSLTRNSVVQVINATGDNTVSSGAATYLWNNATSAWIKVAEFESMDVVLSWSNITGKPASAVGDIDDAVTKRHSHANKATLDLITASGGVAQYNGDAIKNWNTTNW